MSLLSFFSPTGSSGRFAIAVAAALALSAAPAAADATSTGPPSTPMQLPLAAGTADLFAPDVAVGDVRRELQNARRNGLRVAFSVSEAATVRADVLIYGDVVDRELQMSALPAAGPGHSLAKATFATSPEGASVVRVPFNVAARRTLRKFYKITVRLRLIATDAAGNESTAYKRITLALD